MTTDNKVVVGLAHADDDSESVLISYLVGVEALRAGKEAVLWLTKEGVRIALDGFVDKISVPDAPSVSELHAEYVDRGGRIFACPVCIKVRQLQDATLTEGAEIAGVPSLFDFTDGGALVFNY